MLLVVTDPRADHQPLTEAYYVNLPTIVLYNTASSPGYVDIAILCNNMRLICMLAHDILCMRGTISHKHPQEVMTELYFYRDQEEMKEDQADAEEKTVTKDLLLKGVFQAQFHR